MKEIGVLYSKPMVQALLNGWKTETRRTRGLEVFNMMPDAFTLKSVGTLNCKDSSDHGRFGVLFQCDENTSFVPSPYGQPGDRHWVRETCRAEELPNGADGVRYLADNTWERIGEDPSAATDWLKLYTYANGKGKHVPSIHMPRWASRILLEVVSVRVERLQAITEAGAEAEGVNVFRSLPDLDETLSAVQLYATLWDSLADWMYWELNPWVWVVQFKRVY